MRSPLNCSTARPCLNARPVPAERSTDHAIEYCQARARRSAERAQRWLVKRAHHYASPQALAADCCHVFGLPASSATVYAAAVRLVGAPAEAAALAA